MRSEPEARIETFNLRFESKQRRRASSEYAAASYTQKRENVIFIAYRRHNFLSVKCDRKAFSSNKTTRNSPSYFAFLTQNFIILCCVGR